MNVTLCYINYIQNCQMTTRKVRCLRVNWSMKRRRRRWSPSLSPSRRNCWTGLKPLFIWRRSSTSSQRERQVRWTFCDCDQNRWLFKAYIDKLPFRQRWQGHCPCQWLDEETFEQQHRPHGFPQYAKVIVKWTRFLTNYRQYHGLNSIQLINILLCTLWSIWY